MPRKPEPAGPRTANAAPGTTCALGGCELPVVRRAGGGRPRLYCTDAHRAEARRRRLAGAARAARAAMTATTAGTRTARATGHLDSLEAAAGERAVDAVRALLDEALRRLDEADAAEADARLAESEADARAASREEALVATIRAEATAEVLRAQQAAADAARHAGDADDRLQRERGEWKAVLEGLARERAEHSRSVDELSGALEGARAELENELLRHHEDAQRAEALLQAQRAALGADLDRAASELDDLNGRLGAARSEAEQADRRAQRAEEALAAHNAAVVDLEVRAARAEEQSRQAAERLDEARGELTRLRGELTAERRHHRALESQLRRRSTKQAAPGARAAARSTR